MKIAGGGKNKAGNQNRRNSGDEKGIQIAVRVDVTVESQVGFHINHYNRNRMKIFLGILLVVIVVFGGPWNFRNERSRNTSTPVVTDEEKKNKEGESGISIVAVGDVMLGRDVNVRSIKEGDWNYPFLKSNKLFEGADIALANLESPFVMGCKPTSVGMTFCAPNEAVAGLVWSGINVVNLANNHTRNYGATGYENTREVLEKAGLDYCDEIHMAVKKIRGRKIGILGFNLIGGRADGVKIKEVLGKNKALVDLLVVSVHWGSEYSVKSNAFQQEMAKLFIDNGAGLVVGHHPHVIQEIEEYKEKTVVYSLGNFVFDQMWSEQTRMGLAGRFTYKDGELRGPEIISVRIEKPGQPVADGEWGL